VNVPGGHLVNLAKWSNEAYDKIVDEVYVTPPSDKQKVTDLFVKAMEIWLPELPDIPLMQFYHRLPMNTLMGVVVDGSGSVWIATARAGLARFRPSDGAWTYYTMASGLPSDQINAISVDAFDGRRTLYVATANGLASFAAQ